VFITKYTLDKDPTLASFVGLMGEENRRKLAETFLRPTTWKDYCNEVSSSTCQIKDDVAQRSPLDETEYDRYFFERLYTGHFRATENNDCDANNTTCTVSVSDYPCGWAYLEVQAYHLNIALKSTDSEPGSGGYKHFQLVEIWNAANATTQLDNVLLNAHPFESAISRYRRGVC